MQNDYSTEQNRLKCDSSISINRQKGIQAVMCIGVNKQANKQRIHEMRDKHAATSVLLI